MYQKFIEAINSTYWLNIIERFVIMCTISLVVVLVTEAPLVMAIIALVAVREYFSELNKN